jgi:hypothetical protein
MPTRPETRKRQETALLARIATEAPRIPWDRFIRDLQWRPGQHFGLIGPTGQGKTTMITQLLPLKPYVAVFATKPADPTMDRLISQGYLRLPQWESINPREYPRRVVWPDATDIDSVETQKYVFHDAFGKIFREGNWTVVLDETWYVSNILKLDADIKTYLLQARSLGISLVCATQRPASIPVEVYDQSTHLMFWRDNDEANLKRLSGISYRSSDLIRAIISNLDEYQVLYVNTRTGQMSRTKAPAPRGGST